MKTKQFRIQFDENIHEAETLKKLLASEMIKPEKIRQVKERIKQIAQFNQILIRQYERSLEKSEPEKYKQLKDLGYL